MTIENKAKQHSATTQGNQCEGKVDVEKGLPKGGFRGPEDQLPKGGWRGPEDEIPAGGWRVLGRALSR